MPFSATWMQLEINILSEVTQKKTNTIWYYLYVESKKKWYKWTYLQNRKRFTGLENKFTVAGGEEIVRQFGMVMYTMLYLKLVTNKDLLFSTWNSTWCYATAWMGRGFGVEWMHVYVWLSQAVHLKLSQHW